MTPDTFDWPEDVKIAKMRIVQLFPRKWGVGNIEDPTQQDLDRIILWLDLNTMRLARPTKDMEQLHLQEYGGDFIWPDEIDSGNPNGVEHDRPLPR